VPEQNFYMEKTWFCCLQISCCH